MTEQTACLDPDRLEDGKGCLVCAGCEALCLLKLNTLVQCIYLAIRVSEYRYTKVLLVQAYAPRGTRAPACLQNLSKYAYKCHYDIIADSDYYDKEPSARLRKTHTDLVTMRSMFHHNGIIPVGEFAREPPSSAPGMPKEDPLCLGGTPIGCKCQTRAKAPSHTVEQPSVTTLHHNQRSEHRYCIG